MIRYLVAGFALMMAVIGGAPRADAKGFIPVVWGNKFHYDSIMPVPQEMLSMFPELRSGAELVHVSESWVVFWVGGLWLSDKGYGLHNPDDESYYEVTAEDLRMFQDAGFFPDTLPKDGVQPMTYAAGFSVWIVLGLILILFLVARSRKSA